MHRRDECLHCAIVDAVKSFQGTDFDTPDSALDAVAASAEALAEFIARITPEETRQKLSRDHARRLPKRVEEKHLQSERIRSAP